MKMVVKKRSNMSDVMGSVSVENDHAVNREILLVGTERDDSEPRIHGCGDCQKRYAEVE